MEQHLLPDTDAAGRMAEGGGQVQPPLVVPQPPIAGLLKPQTGLEGLSSWATDKGLSEAMTTWQGQVNRLLGKLKGELEGLHGTRKLFQGQDIDTSTQLKSIEGTPQPPRSRLDQM